MRRFDPLASLAALLVVTGSISILHAEPATQPQRDWFAMSPDEFAQTEAAQQTLPFPEIDDRLMNAAILHETNRHRVEHKLPPLRQMPRVLEAAVMHAEDMAAKPFFSHVNPDDPKKREVIDRVKLLKLNPMFVGENIVIHYGRLYEPRRRVFDVGDPDDPQISYEPGGRPIPSHTYQSFARTVVRRWVDSPTHRENVLSKHARFLGSACRAGKTEDDRRFNAFYCVQVFFTPMPGR